MREKGAPPTRPQEPFQPNCEPRHRRLLWEEYRADQPDFYAYSRYCERAADVLVEHAPPNTQRSDRRSHATREGVPVRGTYVDRPESVGRSEDRSLVVCAVDLPWRAARVVAVDAVKDAQCHPVLAVGVEIEVREGVLPRRGIDQLG